MFLLLFIGATVTTFIMLLQIQLRREKKTHRAKGIVPSMHVHDSTEEYEYLHNINFTLRKPVTKIPHKKHTSPQPKKYQHQWINH